MASKKTTASKLPTRQCNHCCRYFNPETIEGAVHLASCRIYNGYTNYETWTVALWIDNDEGLQSQWLQQAQDCIDTCDADGAVASLAIALRDEIKDGEMVPDLGATMWADLLGAALSEVDWHDIAENLIAAAKEG
jgi:hypothetical protein